MLPSSPVVNPKNARERPVTKLCLALEAFRRTDEGRVRDAKAFLAHFFPQDKGGAKDRIFLHMPNEVRADLLSNWGIRGKKSALRDDDDRVRNTVNDALNAGDIDATVIEEGITPEILTDWAPLEDWWLFWRGTNLPIGSVRKALAVARELSLFDERWFFEHLALKAQKLVGTDVVCSALSKEQIVAWMHAIHASGDASPSGLVAALGWETILAKTPHEGLLFALDALARQIGLAEPSPEDREDRKTEATPSPRAKSEPPAAIESKPPGSTLEPPPTPRVASKPPPAPSLEAPEPRAKSEPPPARAKSEPPEAHAKSEPPPAIATSPLPKPSVPPPPKSAKPPVPVSTKTPDPAVSKPPPVPQKPPPVPAVASKPPVPHKPPPVPPAASKPPAPAPPSVPTAVASTSKPPPRSIAPVQQDLPSVIIEDDPFFSAPPAATAPPSSQVPAPPASTPPNARALFLGAAAEPPPMRPPAATIVGVAPQAIYGDTATDDVAMPTFTVPPSEPEWAPMRAEPGDMGWDLVHGVTRPMGTNVQPKYNFEDDDEPTSEINLPTDVRRH